jgi:hypothetical protein
VPFRAKAYARVDDRGAAAKNRNDRRCDGARAACRRAANKKQNTALRLAD